MQFKYYLFLFSFIVLNSCNTRDSYDLYAFLDDANGLNTNSKIYINGFDIGNFSTIEVANNKILAKLTIDEKVKISKSSHFLITDIDMLGSKALKIILNDSFSTFYGDNDTIIGSIKEDIKIHSLDSNTSKKIKPILDSIVSLFQNVK